MVTEFFKNNVKRKLLNKERISGAWIQSGFPVTASIIAYVGFDVAVIDLEHSPAGVAQLLPIIQAMQGTDCTPFVRVPWNDMVTIKKVLDCGAYGIHVPFVSTRAEAENAVKYCKYPPMGVRGAAPITNAAQYVYKMAEYYEKANDEGIVMVAVENLEGAENAEAFTKIEGIDGVFIGPTDMSASMGYLNKSSDKVQEVIRGIEEVVVKSDKFLGTMARSVEEAKKLYERGYNLVVMFSDIAALTKAAQNTVEQFKQLCL